MKYLLVILITLGLAGCGNPLTRLLPKLEKLEVDPDLMMNMIYEALVNDSDKILNNGQKKEEIESGINQIIAWFEEREQYEQCLKLKQIKERCLESK